jgi:hypothetical protein
VVRVGRWKGFELEDRQIKENETKLQGEAAEGQTK